MDDYKFDEFCPSCMWRSYDLMPHICDVCEGGEQWEEAEFDDESEPYLAGRKVIRIKEIA